MARFHCCVVTASGNHFCMLSLNRINVLLKESHFRGESIILLQVYDYQ